jgi:hypothetical protein
MSQMAAEVRPSHVSRQFNIKKNALANCNRMITADVPGHGLKKKNKGCNMLFTHRPVVSCSLPLLAWAEMAGGPVSSPE